MTEMPAGVLIVLASALGLVMGSFLHCLAWRVVHGQSVLHGRSHCPVCGHVLGPLDLVPVLSWLLLRGRCRYCRTHVPIRYPLSELLCAAVYGSLLWRYGLSTHALRFLLLGSILLPLSLVDLDDGWVPDRFLLAGAVGWLLTIPLDPAPLSTLSRGIVGAAALFLPLLAIVLAVDHILNQDSMGGGDLKLFALLGLFFGWQQGLLLVILSCLVGLVFAFLMGRLRPNAPFPFVPAMSLAAWLTALVGEPLVLAYLSLFKS